MSVDFTSEEHSFFENFVDKYEGSVNFFVNSDNSCEVKCHFMNNLWVNVIKRESVYEIAAFIDDLIYKHTFHDGKMLDDDTVADILESHISFVLNELLKKYEDYDVGIYETKRVLKKIEDDYEHRRRKH